MKKTIFALSLMAAAVIGCAPANADTQPVDVANSCSSISTLAETIMTSRQAGVPMRDIVAIANGNSTVELIIQQAYSQSLWRSKGLKQRAITEFSNDWYKSCMQVEDDRARQICVDVVLCEVREVLDRGDL